MSNRHKVHTYKEYHSVCPLVGIGSPASVPLPPEPKGGGGGTRVRQRGEGSPNPNDLRKSLAICLLCGNRQQLEDFSFRSIKCWLVFRGHFYFCCAHVFKLTSSRDFLYFDWLHKFMSPLSILAEPRRVARSQISTWDPKQCCQLLLVHLRWLQLSNWPHSKSVNLSFLWDYFVGSNDNFFKNIL